MIHPRNITRFGGSSSLHAVAMASPRRRARPSLSTVHLTSSDAALVLAFLDGLNLVCAASAADGEAKGGVGALECRSGGAGPDPLPTAK